MAIKQSAFPVAVALFSLARGALPVPECASEDELAELRAAIHDEARTRPKRSGPGPEIERTPRFIIAYDQELRLFAPPWSSPEAHARALSLAEEAWRRDQGDGARAIITFTIFDPGPSDLFYLPVANDVLGLGVGKAATSFDDRPSSSLEGLIFLGEPRQLIAAGETYFREAFLHEIAHRWLAYPAIEHPELEADALRGRQSAHWSYFVSAGSSPMEGNNWQEREPGVFETELSSPTHFEFSPLDAYLMGLAAADEVPSFRVLRPIEVLSPAGLTVDRSSPPAHRNGTRVRLRAEAFEVQIDHLILGSGPRFPGPDAEPTPVRWPVGIVILSRGRTLSPVHRATLADLETRLGQLADDFEAATRGRMRLDLAVQDASDSPLFADCDSAQSCNLAQADRCERLVSNVGFCTRSCRFDAECGGGVCCPSFGFCAPIGACSELPVPALDPAADAGVDGGMSGDAELGENGSGCEAAGEPSAFALLALLLFRLVRRRRGWRGSPA